jgi:ketosteroid isomerase-like protein
MSKRTWQLAFMMILLADFVGVAGNALARRSTASPEFQIQQLLAQQAAAWNRGDIAGFMQGYRKSPETTFAGASGIQRGWQAVIERYQHEYPNQAAMGTLSFYGLEVHVLSKNAAFVLGRWHLERPLDPRGPAGGVFTLILQHFPEGWRIVHDHTSADVPPPAPHS